MQNSVAKVYNFMQICYKISLEAKNSYIHALTHTYVYVRNLDWKFVVACGRLVFVLATAHEHQFKFLKIISLSENPEI